MHSTSDFVEVPRDPIVAASLITQDILGERSCLPKALNNSPMLPTDARAVSLRKKMQQAQCAPVRSLMIVSGCDVADGVPVAIASKPYRQIIAYLHVCAKPERPRDLSVLHLAETRAQGRCDLAELRVRETPDDPAALREAIDAHAEYETASEALRHHYEARLMIAAGSTQRAVRLAR